MIMIGNERNFCLGLTKDRIFQELKKMKEKESEREREEWTKEVLSDKNPNTVASYKKKLEERDATVSY